MCDQPHQATRLTGQADISGRQPQVRHRAADDKYLRR
jgi:hypothetical protein